jgi:hypothetical protein
MLPSFVLRISTVLFMLDQLGRSSLKEQKNGIEENPVLTP